MNTKLLHEDNYTKRSYIERYQKIKDVIVKEKEMTTNTMSKNKKTIENLH